MLVSLNGAQLGAREFAGVRFSRTAYQSGARLDNHCHHYPHLCFVIDGAFQENSSVGADLYNRRSVLLHGHGYYHSNYFERRTTCLNLEFDTAWARQFCVNLPAHHGSLQKNDRILSALMQEIDAEFSTNTFFGESVAIFYALSALKRVAELLQQTTDRRDIWLADLAVQVGSNYQCTIDLSALSALFNLNPSYMARAFRKKTGKTLTSYLHDIRVHKAARILSDSKYASLADVAIATGFADQAHFTRIFSRITGVTPGKFRQLRTFASSGQ